VYYDGSFVDWRSEAYHLNLYIKNTGNQIADGFKVKMYFDEVVLWSQLPDYDSVGFLKGWGGFTGIERVFEEAIHPGDSFMLPPFSLSNFGIHPNLFLEMNRSGELLEGFTMFVEIYYGATEMKKYELEFIVDNDYDLTEFRIRSDIRGTAEFHRRRQYEEFFKLNNISAVSPEYRDISPLTCVIDREKLDVYERIYYRYLNNSFAYNSEIAREAATRRLFWGRVYYRCLYKSLFDVDELDKEGLAWIELSIQNDVNSFAYDETLRNWTDNWSFWRQFGE
jgi:hypothetical protein